MPGISPIAISPLFRRRGGGGYNATTQAWINRVVSEGGSVTGTEAEAVNTFTSNAFFSELDRFWVHGLQSEIAAKTSIANAATSDLITNVNSTTFTAGQGFTGNGSTMYLNTNYNPAVDGVKYTLNSCYASVYLTSDSTGFYVDIGNYIGTNIFYLDVLDSPGAFYGSINTNDAVFSSMASSSSLGLFGIKRSVSNQQVLYRNDGTTKTENDSSSAIPSGNIYLLARNNDGTAGQFSPRRLAVTAIGGGSIVHADFSTAIQSLAATLGFNV